MIMTENVFKNDIVKLRQELTRIEQKFSKSKEDANEFSLCKTLIDHLELLDGQVMNVRDEKCNWEEHPPMQATAPTSGNHSIVLRYFILFSANFYQY